jgi:predicted DNA-binding transcriptional regulator AlpA
MTDEQRRYLDEAATARHLGVSRRTLQRMRTDGSGPQFLRCGQKRVLYSPAEIAEWVARHTYRDNKRAVRKT